jgi:hypothetical protein
VERISVLYLGVGVGTAERQEATRHQPVEVPVLDLINRRESLTNNMPSNINSTKSTFV